MTQDSLLHKARQLIQLGVIVAAPVPALADDIEIPPPAPVSTAALQVDFSGSSTYSNSGFFTGEFDDSKATGSTLGMGFKLSGESVFQDSQVYSRRYSSCVDNVCDPYSLYYQRGDTTGTALFWGGKVTGNLVHGDRLKAAYEFTIDWTHTDPQIPKRSDYAWVNWGLTMGFANLAGRDPAEALTPRLLMANRSYYNQTSGSLSDTGATTLADEFGADYYDYGGDGPHEWYWFVLLEAHLAEAGPNSTDPGDPAPANMNGDYLRLTVPQNSIDIGVNAVPVPEPESWAMGLAGLTVAGLLAKRRRRARG